MLIGIGTLSHVCMNGPELLLESLNIPPSLAKDKGFLKFWTLFKLLYFCYVVMIAAICFVDRATRLVFAFAWVTVYCGKVLAIFVWEHDEPMEVRRPKLLSLLCFQLPFMGAYIAVH